MKRCTMWIGATLLSLLAGCDSNPDGPTFPTIPEGTKLPPPNNSMKVAPDTKKDKSSEKPFDSMLPG